MADIREFNKPQWAIFSLCVKERKGDFRLEFPEPSVKWKCWKLNKNVKGNFCSSGPFAWHRLPVHNLLMHNSLVPTWSLCLHMIKIQLILLINKVFRDLFILSVHFMTGGGPEDLEVQLTDRTESWVAGPQWHLCLPLEPGGTTILKRSPGDLVPVFLWCWQGNIHVVAICRKHSG